MSKKKEETGIFSISLEDGEGGDIPGVTKLIQAGRFPKSADQVKNLEPTRTGISKIQASQGGAKKTNLKSLRDAGVLVEIRFARDEGDYRFTECFSYSDRPAPEWQKKLLHRMKLVPSVFDLKGEFAEFSGKGFTYVLEAVGADANQFVQIIHTRASDRYTILISSKSVAAYAEDIKTLLSQVKDESDLHIELDRAV